MNRTFEEYMKYNDDTLGWTTFTTIYGEITLYVSTTRRPEPNEPNVIECKDKMLNEI